MSCVTLTFEVWIRVKVTAHRLIVRELQSGHEMLQTDGWTDRWTDWRTDKCNVVT